MSLITKPNTPSAGTVIAANPWNAEFDTLYSDYNGNITNSNLSASAAIVDTKLGNITTAGKVSGAALTSLTSLPSGAGVIPSINLPASSSSARNVVINGDFDVWQRGTSFTSIANGTYTSDRWKMGYVSSGVFDVNRSTDVPAVSSTTALSNYSLKVTVTTADSSISAADEIYLINSIEGYDWSRIAQQAFTLSFWVKTHRTGTYCVSFVNSGADRSYVAEYVVNAIDTWEKKTVTVSASPSAGTWNYTTGIGLTIYFSIAAGSNYQTTANSWQTGNYLSTSNQVNGVANVTDTFQLSQVQIESGSSASKFEATPFGTTLRRCQRYFWKSFSYGTAPAQNAGNTGALFYIVSNAGVITFGYPLIFPVVMRTTPTLTYYNPGATNGLWRNTTDGADSGTPTTTNSNEVGAIILNPQVAGDGAGELCGVHLTADSEL